MCPRNVVGLVVCAPLVGCVHLGLKQEAVVVDVAHGVATLELLDEENHVEVGERVGGCLIEECAVAVVRRVGSETHEKVGLIGSHDEVAASSDGLAELCLAIDAGVAMILGEKAIVAITSRLGLDSEGVGISSVGNGIGENGSVGGISGDVHHEGAPVAAIAPLDLFGHDMVG